jgi:Flp pilus assembly protein TadG
MSGASSWLAIPRRSRRAMMLDESGAAAVEFALVAPILALMLMGILQFGVTLNNYVELTGGVRTGGRLLAIGRASGSPYSSVTSAVDSAAANLTPGNITITTAVNGSGCSSDATCTTALSSAVGKTATVTATYPCDLTIMNVNFAPHCTLTSTTSEMVE